MNRSLPELLAPLNALVDPLVRLGVANPWLFTPGYTVLEVPGRRSGELRSTPLLGYLAGPLLVVGTVRDGSQWIRNLAAAEDVHVWLWGRRWRAEKRIVTGNVAVLALNRPATCSGG